MYSAIICRLKNVQKIATADNLLSAFASNNLVIIGLDHKENELGIFFPADGQISEQFANAHNLVAKFENGEKVKGSGFFDENRRVRKQTFRKVKSEGFWMPIDSLSFTGGDISTLKEGDQLAEFNGIPLCNKYLTPATIRAIKEAGTGKGKKVKRGETIMFPKHKDTDHWDRNTRSPQAGELITLTMKMHGTSHRIGRVLDEIPQYNSFIQKVLNWFGKDPKKKDWVILNGSRNVIIEKSNGKGYYEDDSFRTKACEKFVNQIHKGEMIYGEIVGWAGPNTTIMQGCDTKATNDKEFIKKYGPRMEWTWGLPAGTCEFYVYRITNTNEDGVAYDLPWAALKARCEQLGVKHVPELKATWVYDGNEAELIKTVKEFTDGEDILCSAQCREGCMVRIEGKGVRHFKSKSYWFYVLEGIWKSDPNLVDREDIA